MVKKSKWSLMVWRNVRQPKQTVKWSKRYEAKFKHKMSALRGKDDWVYILKASLSRSKYELDGLEFKSASLITNRSDEKSTSECLISQYKFLLFLSEFSTYIKYKHFYKTSPEFILFSNPVLSLANYRFTHLVTDREQNHAPFRRGRETKNGLV